MNVRLVASAGIAAAALMTAGSGSAPEQVAWSCVGWARSNGVCWGVYDSDDDLVPNCIGLHGALAPGHCTGVQT